MYLSSHGYGHCIRTGALVERLARERAFDVHVIASCPRRLWPEPLAERTASWREEACDVGVAERDDLHVDRDLTARRLSSWTEDYEGRVHRETRWLRERAMLVVADAPPLAFDAADAAGIPAVATANFSWDWIYEQMGLEEAAAEARASYGKAAALLALEPAAPMPAFAKRIDIGVVGRQPSVERHAMRTRLGVAAHERLVVVAFRGWNGGLVRLPPPALDVRYALPDSSVRRDDVVVLPPGIPLVDLVAAADAVVAKPGYGIIGDTASCGTPLLYTDRAGFPEHDVLRSWLEKRPGAHHLEAESLAAGTWSRLLEQVLGLERPEPVGTSGVDEGARELARFLPT